MGRKYIIELEETAINTDKGDLYRAKGFNTLVFDMNGLSKLERYDRRSIVHEAYERGKQYGHDLGMSDAAAIMRKICSRGYDDLTFKEIMWAHSINKGEKDESNQ